MHEAKVSSYFHPVKTGFLNAYPVFLIIFFKLEQDISAVRNIKSAKHSKENCFSSSAYSDKREDIMSFYLETDVSNIQYLSAVKQNEFLVQVDCLDYSLIT